MDMTSLSTIKEIASNMASKTISPVEIDEAHLNCFDKLQPRLIPLAFSICSRCRDAFSLGKCERPARDHVGQRIHLPARPANLDSLGPCVLTKAKS
jgi:hypothetical protein